MVCPVLPVCVLVLSVCLEVRRSLVVPVVVLSVLILVLRLEKLDRDRAGNGKVMFAHLVDFLLPVRVIVVEWYVTVSGNAVLSVPRFPVVDSVNLFWVLSIPFVVLIASVFIVVTLGTVDIMSLVLSAITFARLSASMYELRIAVMAVHEVMMPVFVSVAELVIDRMLVDSPRS